jgi:glycine/serine hydroxymethyltransferase
MKEPEMLKIAELLRRTVIEEEVPQNIKKDVARLSAEFQRVEYCFQK